MSCATDSCATEAAQDIDQRISAVAAARLRASGYRSLGALSCESRAGVLLLSGVVPTFYLKQMALAIVLRVDQVREVRNLVEVR